VLYIVGNDQLKGFGVSLTVGLVISLFTSLYMTRLLFDLWLNRNWLHKLSMFRLFHRPNINFMGIRYYWFTATILLTIFGITVFLLRGKQGLNIDFVGGTAYGGQLIEKKGIQEMRELLDEANQHQWLQVADVKQVPGNDQGYEITYRDPDGKLAPPTLIEFPEAPAGADAGQREESVKKRAEILPDWSVELIYPSAYQFQEGNQSRYFTVRTSEKAPELVQAEIDRLLGADLNRIEIVKPKDSWNISKDGTAVTLQFQGPNGQEDVYASPSQVQSLLQRQFNRLGLKDQFDVRGVGKSKDNRYQTMEVHLSEPVKDRAKLVSALDAMRTEFAKRPQPDRLETFDRVLAEETQNRAMYAILASWGAILLYLWFRFGSWTFGLAAVLCLIHDLFFTMGIIAFCHYIHVWAPGVANALLLQDFKIDLPAVAALLTLVGYSVNDTIVVFYRIREVRGKNPELTPQTINDSVNQTLSRTLLTSFATWLVVIVLYIFGGEGVHLFAFCMVIGVIVGTYSSIYIASPLLLIFGEGKPTAARDRKPAPEPERITS
jgi:SecD/SecF fusion protein